MVHQDQQCDTETVLHRSIHLHNRDLWSCYAALLSVPLLYHSMAQVIKSLAFFCLSVCPLSYGPNFLCNCGDILHRIWRPKTQNYESSGDVTDDKFASSIRAYLIFCTMNCTGLMSLNECSTSWQWQYTGVFKIRHRGTWSTAAFQSLTSPADNICDLPVVTSWLYLVFDEIHSAVGPSLSGVRWLGIYYLTVFGIHRTAAVVSDVI